LKSRQKRMSARPSVQSFSLLDNAYRFLNQSLRHSRKAIRNGHEWLFAIFNITQSIELMLKSVLRAAHPALIFEDVDNPKRTVSLRQALTRLEKHAGVVTDEKEQHVITRHQSTVTLSYTSKSL
jgi:HEPN domain-containing protein